MPGLTIGRYAGHGAVGGLSLADLQVIERLDADTRTVVERYAAAGGAKGAAPLKAGALHDMEHELVNARDAVNEALDSVRRRLRGGD